MHQPIVLRIALRYLYGKTTSQFTRYIFWISSGSIVLSIIIIIVILSIMNGFENKLKKNVLNLVPHVIITATDGYIDINRVPDFLSSSIVSNNIEYTKPLIISNIILQSTYKLSLGIMFGINPNHFEPLSKYLIYNNINQLVSGNFFVIIGSKLAKQLSVNINDKIRLTIPSINRITPFGWFPSQRVFTISDIYITNSEVDNYQILMHQDDAAKLMNYPPQCITGWRIWLNDPFKIIQYNSLHIPQEWNWKDWSQCQGSLFQAIKIEKNVMFILLMLIILVSGFSIISFLILLISNKQKEVAILKTYGLNRFDIFFIFITQVLLHGILSLICGSILGIWISKKINQILHFFLFFSNTLQFPIDIQYMQIFTINLMVCVLIISAAFYPAWYISKTQPAQVLRYD